MAEGTELAKAYVQILPSTRGMKGQLTEALGGEADEAGEKAGQSIAGKIGKLVGGLAVGAAIKKVGSAITDVVKQSVDAAGSFEQLAGGVEKIFDGFDTSKIMADAGEAYKELGLSANDYLETINDVGAGFVASMGAEKGYKNAQKGLKAISDYASGTGKSVDVLKEKFGMITRATSSYQSIADQFSGILPATSADFLKQAQAAGFLSESYTKLTEVPIAEYQQAVTDMLEKGVDALNLTNNTANEATGTLTGSLGMLSAAWQNALTAFGTGEGAEEAVGNLGDSITAVINNLLPVVENVLPEIPKMIDTLAPMLVEKLPGLAEELIPGITEMIVSLGLTFAENAPAIITGLVSGLSEAAPMLVEGAVQMITTLATGLTSPETLMPLLFSAIEILIGLTNAVAENSPLIAEAIPEIIFNLVAAIIGMLPDISAAGVEIVTSLVIGILDSGATLVGSFIDIWDNVDSEFSGFITEAWTWGVDLLKNFISGIQSKVGDLVDKLKGVAGKVKSFLGFSEPEEGPLSNFHTFAPDMMELFIEGIDGEEKRLTGKIEEVFDFRDKFQAPEADVYTFSETKQAEVMPVNDGSERIVAEIESLKTVVRSLQIVLDSGALVGGLSDGMDFVLGIKSTLAGRGL